MAHPVRKFDLARVRRIWGRTLKLHLALYAGYVGELNKLASAAGRGPARGAPAPDAYARRFAFEYNGVVLHESFFEGLSGEAVALRHSGGLARAFKRDFGGFSGWKSDVRQLAKVRGVGWIATIRGQATGRLHNVWIDQHQLSVPAAADILLLIDLWEHAWLLDYAPSERDRFVTDIIEQVNWSIIEARFDRQD
jgi:superoxide dismutase, Fe-Mn family